MKRTLSFGIVTLMVGAVSGECHLYWLASCLISLGAITILFAPLIAAGHDTGL